MHHILKQQVVLSGLLDPDGVAAVKDEFVAVSRDGLAAVLGEGVIVDGQFVYDEGGVGYGVGTVGKGVGVGLWATKGRYC